MKKKSHYFGTAQEDIDLQNRIIKKTTPPPISLLRFCKKSMQFVKATLGYCQDM